MTKTDFPSGFRWGAVIPPDEFQTLADTGIQAVRLDANWARVFPEGTGASDPRGIAYYDRLIDSLVEKEISPCLLLGGPLPEALEQQGGWTNRDTAGWFEDYAEALFGAFGDRVKTWSVELGPAQASGTEFGADVQSRHHRLLAHAGAVEAYRGSRRGDGRIGPLVDLTPVIPASDKDEDITCAHFVDEEHNRWWLDPLLHGAYPVDLAHFLDGKGIVPRTEPVDLNRIAAARPDYWGVIYSGRRLIRHQHGRSPLAFEAELDTAAEGLYDLLVHLRIDTGALALSVTQTGAGATHWQTLHRALEAGVPLESWFGQAPWQTSAYREFLKP